MKRSLNFITCLVLLLTFFSCRKEHLSSDVGKVNQNLSLKAAFDQQYAKSGLKYLERSFNKNYRTEILWDKAIFKTADTAIIKVKLLEDVRIYTNDSIPVNMSDNLVVKATKNTKGEWVFVKVMYLPEYGKDLPTGFTGRIISESYFEKNYMVAKYLGGHAYFATFNSGNPWIDYNNGPILKAGGLPNDPRYTVEEEGQTVYAYVNGELNSIWYRPPSPTPPVCADDPILTGGGGDGGEVSGGGGGPSPTDELSAEEMAELANLEQQYRTRMEPEELAIYEKMSSKNKFAYLTNAKQAEETAISKFPANTLYNGKGDAFRHAFFHALNSITIGKDLSKQLGDAHETRSDPTEKSMDLHNNAVGREFLQNSKVGESPAEFISRSLTEGTLRYLTPLGMNNTVIPNVTKLVPTNQ